MKKFIMAIDQGTTGTRVMIVNNTGQIVSTAYTEFPQIYPKPGWVEHNAEIIWDSTMQVMRQALDESAINPETIAGIGITNQRETSVIWDRKTLRPVHNAIVWQCRRSAGICDKLKAAGHEPVFQKKTGLVLDAYFSGTKIKWLFDEYPDLLKRARAGELAFGTIDTWLIAKLTNGKVHATDYTNASRTLLYNIHEEDWDDEILGILDIPREILPKVVPSSGIIGEMDKSIIGTAIPISGIAGDQQAALYGQGCFNEGQAKNTYGTGCFLLLNVGNKKVDPKNGLILTLACNADGSPCYATEGSVFIGGAVVQWLRDGLHLVTNTAESQGIAESVPDTNGVYLVPALAGLGAPYWDMYARGGILGITRGTNRAHIVRAALEGIAFQVKDLVGAFEDSTGIKFKELRVDGGACKNNFLMQFQADILGCPVDRSKYIESTGMGAAFLAGIATGLWEPSDIKNLRKSDKLFQPKINEEKRQEHYNGWLDAINRVKSNR